MSCVAAASASLVATTPIVASRGVVRLPAGGAASASSTAVSRSGFRGGGRTLVFAHDRHIIAAVSPSVRCVLTGGNAILVPRKAQLSSAINFDQDERSA